MDWNGWLIMHGNCIATHLCRPGNRFFGLIGWVSLTLPCAYLHGLWQEI